VTAKGLERPGSGSTGQQKQKSWKDLKAEGLEKERLGKARQLWKEREEKVRQLERYRDLEAN